MNDITYRQFDNFPTDRSGDVGYLNYFGRHVPGRGVLPDCFANSILQLVVQLLSLPQLYKQNHPDIVLPLLTDNNAFLHLFDTLYLAVNFRSSNAHATGVKHCV